LYTNDQIINAINIHINHIILLISGTFAQGTLGAVIGFARFVSFICKYVKPAANTVRIIFCVASISIPKNDVDMDSMLVNF
jgi:hypothetical protein